MNHLLKLHRPCFSILISLFPADIALVVTRITNPINRGCVTSLISDVCTAYAVSWAYATRLMRRNGVMSGSAR